MDRHNRAWTSMVVPLLVLALALSAGATIHALYGNADDSRRAQNEISRLRLDLLKLQAAAFGADVRSGGSPALASKQIADGKAAIAGHVRFLTRAGSKPSELDGLEAMIRSFYPSIRRLYAIGTSPGGYSQSPDTDRLLAQLAGRKKTLAARLDRASATYDRTASTASTRAALGSAATLLLLMAAFQYFYRRSAKAGLQAQALAAENERLWRSSRDDAITDELTGLRNRRALQDDFEDKLNQLGPGDELMLVMFDLDGFKLYNDTFGHGAGDALLARLGQQLADTVGSEAGAYRMGGDEFCIVAEAGTVEGARLAGQAANALSDAGEGWKIGCSYGVAWAPTEAEGRTDALRLADQRMYAHKASRSTAGKQTVAALLQVLAEQGDGLDGHASAVAELSILTAEELGFATHDAQQIGLAAELHDIGKAAVPDAILNKPGKLDQGEWEFIRRHTLIGERIILAAPALDQVASIVRSSHERVDGNGYPDALAGEAIPIGSRIVAVADAFDAMVSGRPYGEAVSATDAIAELRRCAGTQFDPAVVGAFVAVMGRRADTPAVHRV